MIHRDRMNCPSCNGWSVIDSKGKIDKSRECSHCGGKGSVSIKFSAPAYEPSPDPVRELPSIHKVCELCDENFLARSKQSKYCDMCKGHPPIHAHVCKLCGSRFKSRHHFAKFCSIKCRVGFTQSEKYDMECGCCGTSFKGKVEWQRFCSPICQKVHKRELSQLRRWQKMDDEIAELELSLSNGTANEGNGTEAGARTRLRALLAKRDNRDRPKTVRKRTD